MKNLIKYIFILSLALGFWANAARLFVGAIHELPLRSALAQKKPEEKPKPKSDLIKGFQKDDSPVQIEAQTMEILRPEGKVLFEGNVVLKRAGTIIKCAKLTAYYSEKDKDLKKGICEGNVRINMKGTFGTCKKGTFDNANQLITMDGSPVIYQKEQIIRGKQLKYYMVEDRVTGTNVTIIRNPGGKHP